MPTGVARWPAIGMSSAASPNWKSNFAAWVLLADVDRLAPGAP
jgi:hypothetical protein